MKYNNFFLFIFLLVLLAIGNFSELNIVTAQEYNLKLTSPLDINNTDQNEENNPSPLDIKDLPDFPKTRITKLGSTGRISTVSSEITLNSRLRLIIDNFINTKTSMVGDYFKAHVLEDFYLQTNPSQLIIPKGSWLRGRINLVKKPIFFTKTGRIGLHLDQLVTPLGEVIPINVELNIQHGIVNENGLLDPLPNYVAKNTDEMLLALNITPLEISNNTSFPTIINSLVAGSLIALTSLEDNTFLSKGQELQIVLQKNIQFKTN